MIGKLVELNVNICVTVSTSCSAIPTQSTAVSLMFYSTNRTKCQNKSLSLHESHKKKSKKIYAIN